MANINMEQYIYKPAVKRHLDYLKQDVLDILRHPDYTDKEREKEIVKAFAEAKRTL